MRTTLSILLLGILTLGPVACGDRAPDPEEMTAEEVLDRAADRMERAETFAFLLEHENGTTTIVRGLQMERAEGRISGGERMEAEVRARAGPINVNVRVVILPEGSWMTNPLTGQWEPESLSISQFFDPAIGVTALMRDLSEARIAGIERVGGESVHRIEATVDSGGLATLVPAARAGRPLQVRAWIGTVDPVVRRVEIVGALEDGESPELVRRLSLSDFEAEFTIEPPR